MRDVVRPWLHSPKQNSPTGQRRNRSEPSSTSTQHFHMHWTHYKAEDEVRIVQLLTILRRSTIIFRHRSGRLRYIVVVHPSIMIAWVVACERGYLLQSRKHQDTYIFLRLSERIAIDLSTTRASSEPSRNTQTKASK